MVKGPYAQRERGFALLVVLWSLVLITLLTTQILASGRSALQLARNVRAAAQGRAAADGAINEAIFHLVSTGTAHWPADGSARVLGTSSLPVSVRIDSLAGTINPNLASPALLAGLFQAVGAEPAAAKRAADGIVTWRSLPANRANQLERLAAYRRKGLVYGPPGHNFADLSELTAVSGVPRAYLALVLPHMSLYQSGDPNPAEADPIVRAALALSGLTGAKAKGDAGAALAVSIDGIAGAPGDMAVRRQAIVSIQPGPVPFKLLLLTDGY